jgi:hypothetical protein
MNLPPCFTDSEAKRAMRQLCAEQRVDVELLQDLCSLMHEHTGKARIEGIDDQIATTIDRFLERAGK